MWTLDVPLPASFFLPAVPFLEVTLFLSIFKPSLELVSVVWLQQQSEYYYLFFFTVFYLLSPTFESKLPPIPHL